METSSGLARNGSIATGRFCFCACNTSSDREVMIKSKRKFMVVVERDEAGYDVASVPALRSCHTQAKTLDTLRKHVREVIELCIEDGNKADDSLDLAESSKFRYDPPAPHQGEGTHPGDGTRRIHNRPDSRSHVFFKHPDGRATAVPVHPRETLDPVYSMQSSVMWNFPRSN
jgi:predicted RNase H-like HicB family nuclease